MSDANDSNAETRYVERPFTPEEFKIIGPELLRLEKLREKVARQEKVVSLTLIAIGHGNAAVDPKRRALISPVEESPGGADAVQTD